MSIEELKKKLATFTPPKHRRKEKCPLCGKTLDYFDHLRGKCSCQILTPEDLNKRMTI